MHGLAWKTRVHIGGSSRIGNPVSWLAGGTSLSLGAGSCRILGTRSWLAGGVPLSILALGTHDGLAGQIHLTLRPNSCLTLWTGCRLALGTGCWLAGGTSLSILPLRAIALGSPALGTACVTIA